MDDSAAKDAAGEAAHEPAATPQGADVPSADPAGDSPTTSEQSTGEEASDADGGGRMPMPSPWAIAVAVLALLAFGVVVGTSVAKGHRKPTVLLADLPTSAAPATGTSTTTTSAPESTGASTSEPEAEATSEPEPEAEESSSETEEASEAQESSKAASKSTSKETSSTTATTTKEETTASGSLPPVKHVFLIVLGEQGYDAAYGTRSKAPYLADTLRKQGELIDNYYAVSGDELANSIALISGQGPTPQTAAGCPTYEAITPGSTGKDGQVLGNGCVYPAETLTIANQLEKAGLTWKAYVQGLEGGQAGAAASCRHPALGEADSEHAASASDPYVTWRNPFVYFSSVTEGKSCEKNDVALEQLATDLKSSSTTPSFSYISPDPCDDGSEQPCAAGKPAGLAALDGFLEAVVPEIERSTAYREGGLIAITSAEASQTGPDADSSGCCLNVEYPNLAGQSSATSTTTTTTGTTTSTSASTTSAASPAGGRVGMLLLSQYVKPNSSEVTGQYNHFSLLLSVESLFKLSPALGYADAEGLLTFESSVFTAYK